MSTPDGPRVNPKTDVEDGIGGRSPLARFGVPDTDRHVDTGQHSAARPTVDTKSVNGDDAVCGPNGPGSTNTLGQAAKTAERYKAHG
jgi:hypothetical protein